MEPEQSEKRDTAAARLVMEKSRAVTAPPKVSVEEKRQRIKEVRQYARDNIGSLLQELQDTLSKKYPGVKVTTSITDTDAVSYISGIADGINTVSINNSSIVTQELKPGLLKKGFDVINSYVHEYTVNEKKIKDYWDLPRLFDRNLSGTFNIAIRMDGLPETETRKYLAVLGVNAVSAEDGIVFFMEHFSNINKDLVKANKIILVVGLDKIVKSREDAFTQTESMGIFGMENIILGIGPQANTTPVIDELPLPPGDKERELHVIILDNGRSRMLEGKFSDLFLCIGCRACNKHCPIRHSFTSVDYIWTPRNYLNQFLYGTEEKSIDVCLHCEACYLECPLDINLPQLMWQAKLDHLEKHRVPFYHILLGRPEILGIMGSTFAPIATLMMKIKLVRVIMEYLIGIDRRTILPEFHFKTFKRWLKKNG